MISRGELCKGCGRECRNAGLGPAGRLDVVDPLDPAKSWPLTQCPREFVAEIVDEVNFAQLAEHHLPAAGGLLEQSAWWVDLWMALKSDCSQIDNEKAEREARKYG